MDIETVLNLFRICSKSRREEIFKTYAWLLEKWDNGQNLISYRDIIKAPIITEKSSTLATQNVITFSVDVNANKTQIKQAIEKIFNVKVESVNTVNVKPKKKRVGRYVGKTNKVKKAIVKLKEGSSIELN